MKARSDYGVASACVLAAIGTDEHENESRMVRAHVGAIILLEAFEELKAIRKSLSAPAKRG